MGQIDQPSRSEGGSPEERPATGSMLSPWVLLRSASMHPFLFSRMIREADPAARPGDVVNVYDKSGQFFGRGLFNSKSRIVVRMLAYGDAAIDEAFWRARIDQAVELRERLGLAEHTDAYRLVHAEGDGLSGLIVERYADCLVLELFSRGMFDRADMLARFLGDRLGSPSSLDRPDKTATQWRVLVRADSSIEGIEGFRVRRASQPAFGQVTIREHGVRYRVDPTSGQKTGFFCDQRENRRRFAALCRGASVLDACCYSGGFALCAKLLGGAAEVDAVDLDESAVELAKENAKLNQTRIHFVHADAFAYLRQMAAGGRRFDAVVLDPPKLATSRDELEEAIHKYQDLNLLAMQVVRPGGVLVTCSCSGLVSRETFTEAVYRAARRGRRMLQLFDVTGPGGDHPVMQNCPESGYLKVLWFRVYPTAGHTV
ncbi:MAG: class I SAM-dependent rRNA methyltransferase [Planctomycetota bacterium]